MSLKRMEREDMLSHLKRDSLGFLDQSQCVLYFFLSVVIRQKLD